MLKQNGTLAKIASLSFLTLCLDTQAAQGFTLISFDGYAARWNKTSPIQIELDPDFGVAFSKSGCDSSGVCTSPTTAVQNSVNAWKNVQNVSINVDPLIVRTVSSTPHYDGKNQVKFYSKQWENLPFAPPSSALAVTITTYGEKGNIEDSDMFINGMNFQWAVVNGTGESNYYDVQNVVTHEFGHFFGLDHTSNNSMEPDQARYDATMFYASYPGDVSRQTLEDLDIAGIQHLYTSVDVGAPEVSDITPNQIEVSYKGSITVEVHGSNFQNLTSVVLARNTDEGDVIGRVISVSDDTMSVSFDISNTQSGQYDVVVANSYNEFVRLEKGFSIQNNTVIGTYNNDSNPESGGGCQSNGNSSLLLFLLPALLILPRRYKLNA